MQPWEQPARQLPFAPRPAPGETVISYLARLATANNLDPVALLKHIAGPHRAPAHTPTTPCSTPPPWGAWQPSPAAAPSPSARQCPRCGARTPLTTPHRACA
jgi:hypothetical protein